MLIELLYTFTHLLSNYSYTTTKYYNYSDNITTQTIQLNIHHYCNNYHTTTTSTTTKHTHNPILHAPTQRTS